MFSLNGEGHFYSFLNKGSTISFQPYLDAVPDVDPIKEDGLKSLTNSAYH